MDVLTVYFKGRLAVQVFGQISKLGITIIVALTLSACNQYFRSDVTSFYEAEVPHTGAVRLVPMNPDKRESIEFKQYASVLGTELDRVGFTPAGDGEPDYIIGYDVKINDGREKIENRSRLHHRTPYWRSSFYWGYWGPVSAYGFHRDRHHNELVARTVYRVELHVEIRKPDGTMVYEGRAESDTRTNNLPQYVGPLARSLFIGYPGNNGETARVQLELPDE